MLPLHGQHFLSQSGLGQEKAERKGNPIKPHFARNCSISEKKFSILENIFGYYEYSF
jgi:hypothetical protein